MGGKDLCKRPPRKVVMDILSYAKFLHDGVGIRHVIVGQLLLRQPWATRPGYNDDAVTVNTTLKKGLRCKISSFGLIGAFGRTCRWLPKAYEKTCTAYALRSLSFQIGQCYYFLSFIDINW